MKPTTKKEILTYIIKHEYDLKKQIKGKETKQNFYKEVSKKLQIPYMHSRYYVELTDIKYNSNIVHV